VTFQVDGEALVAGPGAKVVVAAGVRHSFQNTGSGSAHLEVEAQPALQPRESIEEGATLMRAEKFTATGKPRSLRAVVEAAALARRYRDTVVLSSPSPALQRLLFPLLAGFSSSGRCVSAGGGGADRGAAALGPGGARARHLHGTEGRRAAGARHRSRRSRRADVARPPRLGPDGTGVRRD
jgi:hypothetical protein